MKSECYPFVNLPLPYAYNALEPYIDEKTMRLHHDRHLQTYINNLNALLKENPQLQNYTPDQLICISGELPCGLRTEIRNNAGGVFNHRFFFAGLKKAPSGCPSGAFETAIGNCYGSFECFCDELKKAALSVFGSGYAWVVEECGKIGIVTTPNQDTPKQYRLLAVDVWEHAYYLKHYNKRADYIDGLMNVIDWGIVSERYEKIHCGKRR